MTAMPELLVPSAKVWRDYDQAALDVQYNSRGTVPDLTLYTAQYKDQTLAAKARWRCVENVDYGPRPDEQLDIYPASVANAPVMVFLHGGDWQAFSKEDNGFGAPAFVAAGVTFVVPDLNAPDFTTMTMSRMLEQLTTAIANTGGRATLIGSSLGAALAVLAAGQMKTAVERLVLMAPAVMLAKPGHSLLPPDRIAQWERNGATSFFHYGFDEERMLNFEFYADSLRHDPYEVDFPQPTLIFQGRRDVVVDYRSVESFARTRDNVTLRLLDDDHQLTASLPYIWQETAAFLEMAV